MRVYLFDQYEFESWESEEYLAVAIAKVNQRGSRINSFSDFYSNTCCYDAFDRWQTNTFNSESSLSVNHLENSSAITLALKEQMGIDITPDQQFIIHHNEWNLIDILWKNETNYYRAMWCTTA